VAAALRKVPGASETARVTGSCGVIARAGARDVGELAKRAIPRVRTLDGVTRKISYPAVHL